MSIRIVSSIPRLFPSLPFTQSQRVLSKCLDISHFENRRNGFYNNDISGVDNEAVQNRSHVDLHSISKNSSSSDRSNSSSSSDRSNSSKSSDRSSSSSSSDISSSSYVYSSDIAGGNLNREGRPLQIEELEILDSYIESSTSFTSSTTTTSTSSTASSTFLPVHPFTLIDMFFYGEEDLSAAFPSSVDFFSLSPQSLYLHCSDADFGTGLLSINSPSSSIQATSPKHVPSSYPSSSSSPSSSFSASPSFSPFQFSSLRFTELFGSFPYHRISEEERKVEVEDSLGRRHGEGGLECRWRPRKSYKRAVMGLPSTKARRRWASSRR